MSDADTDLAPGAGSGAHDDSVAGRLLAAIDAALSAFVADAPLWEAAAPLMRAIEAVRTEARAAVFEVRADHRPTLIAAPSFAPEDADSLALWVAEELGRAGPITDPLARLQARGQLDGREVDLQIHPVIVSDHHAVGCIALVSPADAKTKESSHRGGHLKRFTRIAGIMIEDRMARRERDEREILLSQLMKTSPDAVIRITTQGDIIGFSAAAERMFGWAEADALGRPVSVLMTDEHADRHAGYIARYMETKERRLPNFGRRLEARRKNGEVFTIELALAEFEESGETLFVGIIRDVSQRVQNERQVAALRDARARARERFALLTPREEEVMRELVTGAANKVVARTLGLSPRTVEFHRARVFEKTGVQSVAELVRLALEAELEPGA